MKKLVLFLMLAVSMAVTAQSFVAPAKIVGWGTAADTLVASATKNFVFDLKSDHAGTCKMLLFTDAVSGTPAFSAVLSGSIDGILYMPLDTITHSGGGDKTAYFDSFQMVWNKMKVAITATGAAQKSRLYVYGVARF